MAAFVGHSESKLEDALLRKPFRSAGRSSSYAIALEPSQAAAARDAVCATTYARLFDWLVRRVAQALAPPDTSAQAALSPSLSASIDHAFTDPSRSIAPSEIAVQIYISINKSFFFCVFFCRLKVTKRCDRRASCVRCRVQADLDVDVDAAV